jgi:hypothetical protein
MNLQFFTDLIENGQQALAARRKTHGITFEISDKFLDDYLTAGFRGMYFTSNEGSAGAGIPRIWSSQMPPACFFLTD